ncbi:L,D-transpeptidase family protein [Xanthocytophaga agilis]|uniref:L,D-transpeptidase family protein n=1 Tax=Xanthocytophaga agilis TaxID=3048010 RepID=A0AAE3UF49_9BACT|nr:L,D-transpeptidase family protein [Xanthocytophaga agilis]MDJ1503473.1 L,D-transpeptidase family protein [Xanthocytophaga agilis]
MQEINHSANNSDRYSSHQPHKSFKEKLKQGWQSVYTWFVHWKKIILTSPFVQKYQKGILTGIAVVGVFALLLTIPSVRQLLRSRTDRWEALREEASKPLSITLNNETARRYFPQEFRRNILVAVMDTFYTNRMYLPAWIGEKGNTALVDSLVTVLSQSGQEGFDTTSYQLDTLRKLRSTLTLKSKPEDVAHLDRLATASYLLYASHMLWGRVDPGKIDTMWQSVSYPFALSKNLQEALEENHLQASLTQLLPSNQYYSYEALKQKFVELCIQEQKGGWPAVTINQSLHKGSNNPAVKQLKQRLIAEGDLAASTTNLSSTVYDQTVVDAVKNYQARYGLQVTGNLTKETRTALAVPLKKRIQQVALNLERLRWLPRQYPSESVWINIPEFSLRVWDQDKQVWETRIVVGKPNKPTPILTDTLEQIILNPDWVIPQSIAVNEMLPQIRQTPEMLEENEFEVYESWKKGAPLVDVSMIDWDTISTDNFTYKIAQKPGDKNALGKVKFLFPNHYDTYLHDTPAKGLFNVKDRAYSHGCVRVENPLKLAYYLLKSTGKWTEEKIIEQTQLAMLADEDEDEIDTVITPEKIDLKKPIAVTTLYLTAFVRQGRLYFCPDIYGYDVMQTAAMSLPAKPMIQPIVNKPHPEKKSNLSLTSLFSH